MNKFIVCTWWTHVWKTSVLEYLETIWYKRHISVAWKYMEMLSKLFWDLEYRTWRTKNFSEFQRMNIFADLELYFDSLKTENTKDGIIFFDRWIFDWIASLKRENIEIPESIEELVSRVEYYKKVFIFEPIWFHEQREQTWRMLNEETSLKWTRFIEEEYKWRWYEIVKVPDIQIWTPEENIKARAKFLLDNI